MASNTMGQYRYTGRGLVDTIEVSNSDIVSTKTATTIDSYIDNASFKDILISPKGGLKTNIDYHITIRVPRDMNYTMDFDVQLVRSGNNYGTTYQFIKTVTLEQGGNTDKNNIYTVVLYESLDSTPDNEIIKAMIPLPYDPSADSIKDAIYFQKINDKVYKYHIGTGKKDPKYLSWDKVNDMLMTTIWKHEETDTFGIFDFTFKPIENFTGILLKMKRTAEDYNIQTTVTENGQTATIYGRVIDPKKVTYTLQTINNLVPELTPYPAAGLSRIGVWSHPNLLMVINGEEIRVPASGYYELDAIPITSLGIVVLENHFEDFFTIDYEYQLPEG